jgi:hypothetical protein
MASLRTGNHRVWPTEGDILAQNRLIDQLFELAA